MCGQDTQDKLPDNERPILKRETTEHKTNFGKKLTDEEARSQAIQIVNSRKNSVYEEQKKISSNLQTQNINLQKITAELIEKQQVLSSIQETITIFLRELDQSFKDIKELQCILDEITSDDLSKSREITQRIIEIQEKERANNINNSVSKQFYINKENNEENKYNISMEEKL